MRAIILLLLVLAPFEANSGSVQVPENCLNRISPCLVRAEDSAYQFKFRKHKLALSKDSILKIHEDDKNISIELVDGYLSMIVDKNEAKQLGINEHPIKEGRWMASRNTKKIGILNLENYNFSEYQKKPGSSKLERIKSEFINKKDFVGYTKFFFEKNSDYHSFLALEAPKWKDEFDRQNKDQTKVMLRTIAAEKEKARIEAEKKAKEQAQVKKVKGQFFNRTFNR